MSGELALNAAVARIVAVAPMECGLGDGIGSPAESAQARVVDLAPAWV